MLTALLAEGENNMMNNIVPLIILIVFVAVIFVFYFISSRKRKKQEQDAKDLIDAVGPGNKVKTIGGVCGIVVEVDDEENTFVLETGSVTAGKSYIKFDKQAIYQTDAVVEKSEPAQPEAELPAATPEEIKSETEEKAEEKTEENK